MCCLVETFPAHHESLADYLETLKYAYLYAKTVLQCATADPDGRGRALLVGGGIANFTDVAVTFKGIIQAMREMAEQMMRNQQNAQNMPSQEGQQIERQTLDDMLDQIEDLAEQGATDQAEQLLSQLENMLNN